MSDKYHHHLIPLYSTTDAAKVTNCMIKCVNDRISAMPGSIIAHFARWLKGLSGILIFKVHFSKSQDF